jgi:bifunctional non-homologous end joining protein LigD
MLAVAGGLPRDEVAHAFELKWDGIRAVAHWDGTRLRLETRNLRDVTVAYPELAPLGPALGRTPAVLDGEVVALDDNGVPSFQLLQERMHVTDPGTAARRAAERPVLYIAFDLLHHGEEGLMSRRQDERRAGLDVLELAGPTWLTSPCFPGEGQVTMAVARDRGLEGVVAKRLDSPYLPGVRSRAWTKVKIVQSDEFVVGGWLPGEGNRSGRIGALLLGLPDGHGKLTYCGGVGTGFTDADLRRLQERLGPLVTPTNPFTTALPRKDATFVRPEVVVEVAYRERTTGGILRQPSYKGVRMDKGPGDVETGGSGGAPARG